MELWNDKKTGREVVRKEEKKNNEQTLGPRHLFFSIPIS
jgi:hypothetical protein